MFTPLCRDNAFNTSWMSAPTKSSATFVSSRLSGPDTAFPAATIQGEALATSTGLTCSTTGSPVLMVGLGSALG